VKLALRILLAALMLFAGVLHFLTPHPFVAIVPDYLPNPLALVYVSGFFEILFGAGLLIPPTRRYAAWGLILLFIAVFPANINMAVHQIPVLGAVYPVLNWVRLPFQIVLIAWAYWFTKDAKAKSSETLNVSRL
jgi:uncharacterized membrane protein